MNALAVSQSAKEPCTAYQIKAALEAMTLPELVDVIDKLHATTEDAARTAVMGACQIGTALIAAKAKVEHGQWKAWVTDNTRIAPRTASAYMRLAQHLPTLSEQERQRVADLPIRQAVAAITTAAEAPARSPGLTSISRRDKREVLVADTRVALQYFRKDFVHRIQLGFFKPGELDKARNRLKELARVIDELEAEGREQAKDGAA